MSAWRLFMGFGCIAAGIAWVVAGEIGLGCLWVVVGSEKLQAVLAGDRGEAT